jgi:arginase
MINQFILTPYFLDQPLPGLETLEEPGWFVNSPRLSGASPQSRMGLLYAPLADAVAQIVNGGSRPVSVAGDCCASLGVLAGLQRAGVDPALIWFDAHGDFNTWETTPSGFLGGMPLAMLVGRGEQSIVEHLGIRPLPESHVVLSDGRELDPGESQALFTSNISLLPKLITLLDFDLPAGPIWVHFDTDLIDPSQAPAMNYLVEGGPQIAELHQVFSYLAGTGRICAVSMSAWNPEMEGAEQSRSVSMMLLADLIR